MKVKPGPDTSHRRLQCGGVRCGHHGNSPLETGYVRGWARYPHSDQDQIFLKKYIRNLVDIDKPELH